MVAPGCTPSAKEAAAAPTAATSSVAPANVSVPPPISIPDSSRSPASSKRRDRLASAGSSPQYVLYPFIRHGYREPTHAWDALRSLFRLHNQTINIWTHLLGWLYFVWRSPAVLRDLTSNNASWVDFAFVLVYLACAQFQMLASAAYHLFSYVSVDWDRFFLRMDLAGIILMIFGSFAIGLHNGFASQPGWKLVYLVIVSTPLLTAAYLTLSPALQSDDVVKWRNTLLAATVAGGVIPAIHWAVADDSGCHMEVLWAVAAMFGFYGSGFIVFILRFPERYMPHVVIDFIGQSHNLWHVCVWLAGASWLEGMVQFYGCQRGTGECVIDAQQLQGSLSNATCGAAFV